LFLATLKAASRRILPIAVLDREQLVAVVALRSRAAHRTMFIDAPKMTLPFSGT
jgi:hypothetical protein